MPRLFDEFHFVLSVKYGFPSRAAFAPFVEEVSRAFFSFETPVTREKMRSTFSSS